MLDVNHIQAERARHEQEERETAEPVDREHGLEWCRFMLSRYGGADQLDTLPVVTVGPCDDCANPADPRYQLGRFQLCSLDATRRLIVRARLDEQHVPSLLDEACPVDAHAWTIANAGRYTTVELQHAFTRWNIDPDLAVELVDLAADLARAQGEQAG